MYNIGVLALQGSFREHIEAVNKCGVRGFEVKMPDQLKAADGIIIPGGESTTIHKLIEKYGFKEYLDNFYNIGKPIFGTCAGMILIAREVVNNEMGYGYIDLKVKRNNYGRQIDSFEKKINVNLNHKQKNKCINAIFIRAPRIVGTGKGVKVLALFEDDAVLVRQNNVLACTFHPELGSDLQIHKYFVNMVKEQKKGEKICQDIPSGIQ